MIMWPAPICFWVSVVRCAPSFACRVGNVVRISSDGRNVGVLAAHIQNFWSWQKKALAAFCFLGKQLPTYGWYMAGKFNQLQ